MRIDGLVLSATAIGGRQYNRVLHLLVSTLLCCLCALLAGRTQAQDIRVGVVLDQSSFNADLGRDYLAGARTYFDFINSHGGINGRKLTLVVRDDEGQKQKTLELARQLIDTDKVDALFGFVGDEGVEAVAGDNSFKNARIALYAPLSGTVISKLPDNIFYVRPTYREEARHVLNHFNLLGSKRFLILASESPFGVRLGGEISEELAAQKLVPTARLVIPNSLNNLEALSKQIVSLDPQVVIVAADTITLAEFLKKFRPVDKGINVVAFSTVNHRTLLELAKSDAAVGTLISQVVPHPDLAKTRVLAEHLSLMAKFRDEPASHVTLEGFLAAKSFVSSISRLGAVNRSTILGALSGDRRMDLGGINLTFTSKSDRGSTYVDLSMLRRDGRLVQ
jgi:branched-chain amino acid transport system substrate-binding protein